jgi:ribonuclease P protein component
VVSKRIGKAVVRNLIKRRLREATRVRLPRVATGWDVVLIARQSIVDARFSQIERALDSLLTQAGLYEAARELPDVAT